MNPQLSHPISRIYSRPDSIISLFDINVIGDSSTNSAAETPEQDRLGDKLWSNANPQLSQSPSYHSHLFSKL